MIQKNMQIQLTPVASAMLFPRSTRRAEFPETGRRGGRPARGRRGESFLKKLEDSYIMNL
jgi:hypothetical protein